MGKFTAICTAIFSVLAVSVFAQDDTIFKDIVIVNNNIWALTESRRIKIFDLETGDKSFCTNSSLNSKIELLTKNKKGDIVIADDNKEIQSFDSKDNMWKLITKYDSTLVAIVFDEQNVCYGITLYGIENLTTRDFFISYDSMNYKIHSDVSFLFYNPSCYFIDRYHCCPTKN